MAEFYETGPEEEQTQDRATASEVHSDPEALPTDAPNKVSKMGGLRKLFGMGALGMATLVGTATEGRGAENPVSQPTTTPSVEKGIAIDESKVTESGSWSTELLTKIQSEMKEIQTEEDANAFMKMTVLEFTREYFSPTKSKMKEMSPNMPGVMVRDATRDDHKLMLRNAQQLLSLAEDINSRFTINPDSFADAKRGLDEIITKETTMASYKHQKEMEILERQREFLRNRDQH